jgi:hypothetical protein
MKEYYGDYVEQREDYLGIVEGAMSDDDCWNEMDATESCFHWKRQDALGYGTKFYTHLMQRAKYFDKITWGYRPNKECHYTLQNIDLFSTDKIKDKNFQHTNRYILIIQPTFSHDSDARLTDKIEINAFVSLLCLAGALHSKKQSLEELLGTDRDGIKKFTYWWIRDTSRSQSDAFLTELDFYP